MDRYNSLNNFTGNPEMYGGDELRIVLLGKTGVGKSSVGNAILGEKVFKSECSPQSGTQNCQRAEKVINGRKIVVIDTPGIFDTNRTDDEVKEEIVSCLVECTPGPHVFIVVLPVERYTQENQKVVEKLLEYFSGDAVHYMVLLFTHGDNLENMAIHEFIDNCEVHNRRGKQSLKDLVKRCGNRVHVVDNTHWNENSRVSAVLASLQGLNLSEHALREITENMSLTPADQTPWFNVLSEQFYRVQTEHGDESEVMSYRSNSFQLTQLMKSIKHILRENNGQHYSNKTLEEIGKVINVEVKNILKEMGIKRETADMVEIRRRARERVKFQRTQRYCLIL